MDNQQALISGATEAAKLLREAGHAGAGASLELLASRAALYCYRWQEGNGEINEIWGSLLSLERAARRIELPERPFRAELFDAAGNRTVF